MRISDWSSDVCSSDLGNHVIAASGEIVAGPKINRAARRPQQPGIAVPDSGGDGMNRVGLGEFFHALRHARAGEPRIAAAHFACERPGEMERQPGFVYLPAAAGPLVPFTDVMIETQIGKASCRARVLQYV